MATSIGTFLKSGSPVLTPQLQQLPARREPRTASGETPKVIRADIRYAQVPATAESREKRHPSPYDHREQAKREGATVPQPRIDILNPSTMSTQPSQTTESHATTSSQKKSALTKRDMARGLAMLKRIKEERLAKDKAEGNAELEVLDPNSLDSMKLEWED
ncbi:hypothetical protein OE88DRAFT_1646649 [Heliocybe sulcata]|uniref:Uncharacterized protein n=1 Tax=Heliocybe sulcata TaxID=5364 RepID=A0A5C3MUB0_9AGAM|nr:hypothetical protein OE88DRAFT_1646649 [Heliocybe sulcata]